MIWARRLLLVPPVLLGAAMVWQASLVQPKPPLAAPEERRVPVSYVAATPRTFTPRITGYGTIAPARVWTAVAQIAGPIDYINPGFVRGGFVGAGEVLIRIASDDAELTLASADADLKNAEARLEEMQASRQTTLSALEIERKSLDLAEADLNRTRRLAERGAVSESVLQAKQRDVLAQESKVQSLESTLVLLPAQIRAQEQSVAKSKAAKRAAALDLERTVVTAPFDARVARVDVEISQFVGVGTTMGTLDDASTVEIDVQLPQPQMIALARLSAGLREPTSHVPARPTASVHAAGLQERPARPEDGLIPGHAHHLLARVSLSLEQDGHSWPAVVARLSDSISPETRSMGVIVRVTEPYAGSEGAGRPPLIKGMFVRVDLTAPPVVDVILVPRSAIRHGRVMLAGPDDRLVLADVTEIFAFDSFAVLAGDALPSDARIITSEPDAAIEGLLLSPEPDVLAEAKLDLAAHGRAL
jgi:multidrug efflux pump subunit AcrA (membrane-fusion protein)